MAIIISSEDDLFEVFDKIRNDKNITANEIKFEGWPKYEIVIRGEDFNGGMPARIMPALLSFQRTIDIAYSQCIYGEIKRLKKEERRETQFIVYLENGSTRFTVYLDKILNNFLKEAVQKMSSTQIVIVVLCLAVIFGCSWYLIACLKQRAQIKQIDLQIELGRQQNERYQMIKDIASKLVDLVKPMEAHEKNYTKIINILEDNDRLILDNGVCLTGAEGQKIVKKESSDITKIILEGEYSILNVKSGAVNSGFKATIKNVQSSENLIVSIPEGMLNASQLHELQKCEWSKTPIYMKVIVLKQNERILEAVLIETKLINSTVK